MSALRFSFRTKEIRKQILVATHPADIRLRTDAKVCLCGDLDRLPQYHDNHTSLEEADFIVVLGKKAGDIPEMLLHLGQDLCPHGDSEDEQKFIQGAEKLVLQMHQLTPPEERNVLWQRYFHALAQATPDAQDVFRRMAENKGLIQRQFKTVKQVPTGHLQGNGHVVEHNTKARGNNYANYLK